MGAAPRAGQPPAGPRRRGALKIYPAGPDEMALPPDRATYGLASEYTIPYGTNGDAPNVFMHLKNTSDRDLHVACWT